MPKFEKLVWFPWCSNFSSSTVGYISEKKIIKFATIFYWTEIINKALCLTEISTFDCRHEIYLSNCNEIQILLVHLCVHSNAHTASFAKWLSDGLRSQWWLVRVLLHSLQFQTTSLFWARSSLKLRWLHGVDSLDTCMWHDKKT